MLVACLLSTSRPPQHIGLSLGRAGSEGGINFLRSDEVDLKFFLRAFCVCDEPAQVLTGLCVDGSLVPSHSRPCLTSAVEVTPLAGPSPALPTAQPAL